MRKYWSQLLAQGTPAPLHPIPSITRWFIVNQKEKAGKTTEGCSSGIANASNWSRKVYFFKLWLLQQEDIYIFIAMFALQLHCWGSLFALPHWRHPVVDEPQDPLPRDVTPTKRKAHQKKSHKYPSFRRFLKFLMKNIKHKISGY